MARPFDKSDDYNLVNKRIAEAAATGKKLDPITDVLEPACDHGVVFDEVAAQKLLEQPAPSSGDPALDFIMGHPATAEIRKRWPRLDGHCPKGCGFYGCAYASYKHYIMGDW